MKFTFATAMITAIATAEITNHAAVLVAGSNGYWNYRHQADIAHAYHILIANGVSPDNIITMMYDDIADNVENPFPGQLYNHPDGQDLYAGLKIDYRGKDVTPEKFMAVMTGDAVKAGGKVLTTDKNTKLFVNFSDHGAAGLIAFPSSYLYADQLQQTIDIMEEKGLFGEMVFYLEACESGSMFPSLREDQNVYAVTASNATQSSYA
jgi:legumain